MYYRIIPSTKKPKKVNIAKATISAKSTRSIYDAPESWRKSSQPTTASQKAVDAGKTKAAAPAAAKNNKSDEADVTAAPAPHRATRSRHLCSFRTRIGGPSCAKRCVDKNIQISLARKSVQGLKLQAKTVADFRTLQNLLVTQKFSFHTYSLKEEREFRVVLRGVPEKIPVDEPRPTIRRLKPPSSKSGAYAPSPVLKRRSPANAPYPGSVITANPTGTRPVIVFILRAASNSWGDYGTAPCTRNKDTDGPPACVLYKQKGHTANYLGCLHAPKRARPPEKAAPRHAAARAVSSTLSYARAAAGPRNAPPAAKNNQTSADDLSQLMSIISIIDISKQNSAPPRTRRKN
ncbi:hypothetical protein EVAR_80263_1 [Eumeta japonica]|uniref:Nucleic-acid-binding protein from transposon X-element n=1 Tax=Eumeta variegata TaxID=151549 RepID=A0A4C1UCI1_EUMVA|nr:hypothetical protein EVAR_80263_1 [Eumeta japonica]